MPLARASIFGDWAAEQRGWFAGLAALVLIVAVAFKSVLFVDGEPVILNYIVTGMTVGLLGGFVALAGRRVPIEATTGVLAAVAIIWALFSAVNSGISFNIVAVAAFAVLIAGFGLVLPVLVMWSGIEGWRLLNFVLTTMTVLSALVWFLDPGLAIDPDSGRLRGAYVSVAVSCTLFGFNCLLSVREAFTARNAAQVAVWAGIALLAFVLLYFTRTRSSLAELMAGLFIVMAFAPMSRGLRTVMLSLIGIGFAMSLIGLGAVSTGIVGIDDQLQEFRLADRDLTDARGSNWEFGIERIIAQPLFGEGLLAKQTQGGTAGINFDAQTSYDPRYDPHSLILNSGVQGGVPFMIIMLAIFIYIPARFVQTFGLRTALQSPEFVLVTLRLSISMLSGGDMTALGNFIDKICWLLLGLLALKIAIRRHQDAAARAGAAQPFSVAVPMLSPHRPNRRPLPSAT